MIEERIMQRFPRRCPYCDEVLPEGSAPAGKTTEVACPHCGKVFIRVPWEEASGPGNKKISERKRETK